MTPKENKTMDQAPNMPSQTKTSGLAITSLILSILGLICFSILTAIPGVICGHIALSKIKNSGGSLTGRGLAIAGLVIGYIGIVLLPLMIILAIPNFKMARGKALAAVCKVQLQQIASAKQQWATANHKQTGDTPTASDLATYLPNGVMPKCLEGGTYQINAVGTPPTCSVPGHTVDQLGASDR